MALFAYATLEEAKEHLKIPAADTFNDDRIQRLIYAASESVKNYLGYSSAYQIERNEDDEASYLDSDWEPDLQSFGSETKAERVRPVVKEAVLLMVEEFYDGPKMGAGDNYLPPPVRALLFPLRDPSIA